MRLAGDPGAVRRAIAAAAQESDALLAGLDAAVTLEAACVTFVGVARQRGAEGGLDLGPEVVTFLRAAQCQDEAHYHFLRSVGATPTASAFAIPAIALVDRAGFLQTVEDLEAISVGLSMALTRALATFGDPRLVEIAYQMGAVDAQHLVLARQLSGVRPANDRAFAKWRYVEPAEAGQALAAAGFLDPTAETYPFPGPVDRLCSGVFGLVPETTDDALLIQPTDNPESTRPIATPAG
jgi:hypothetical protein